MTAALLANSTAKPAGTPDYPGSKPGSDKEHDSPLHCAQAGG